MSEKLKVVHVPFWDDAYQQELIRAQRAAGLEVIEGKGFKKYGLDLVVIGQRIVHGKFDVLHIHWQHPLFLGNSSLGTLCKGLFALSQIVLLRVSGIRIVWTVHNLINHDQRFHKEERFLTRLLATIASRIIVHCSHAGDRVNEMPFLRRERKVSVIPHGSFIDRFSGNVVGRDEGREILGLQKQKFVFLFMGLIRPYKGVSELIDAFLKLQSDDACLLIAGHIRCEEVLQKASDIESANLSKVTFLNRWIEEEEVPTLYAAADVAVTPYRSILTSGSIVSAMSMSKAVIAPRIGCIPEMLSDQSELLFDSTSETGLYDRLHAAMTLRSSLGDIGAKNKEAIAQFSWAAISEQLAVIYTS